MFSVKAFMFLNYERFTIMSIDTPTTFIVGTEIYAISGKGASAVFTIAALDKKGRIAELTPITDTPSQAINSALEITNATSASLKSRNSESTNVILDYDARNDSPEFIR